MELRIDYPTILDTSLRDVVKQCLSKLSKNADGTQQISISFYMDGVEGITPKIRSLSKDNDTMTILLEYQYYNLEVGEKSFSVDLSFEGVLSRLTIPYTNIDVYADLPCEFLLGFPLTKTLMNVPEQPSFCISPVKTEPETTPQPHKQVGNVVYVDKWSNKK